MTLNVDRMQEVGWGKPLVTTLLDALRYGCPHCGKSTTDLMHSRLPRQSSVWICKNCRRVFVTLKPAESRSSVGIVKNGHLTFPEAQPHPFQFEELVH